MKKTLIAILKAGCGVYLALSAAQAFAQSDPVLVDAKPIAADSKITAVTLYRGRAAVTRSTTVNLQPGVYEIQIAGLPESIQPQSLQTRTRGAIGVLNVDFSLEQKTSSPTQFAEIDARIDNLQQQIKALNDQRDVLKSQEQFIDAISAKAATEAIKESGTAQLDLDAMRRQLSFIGEERGRLLAARHELDVKQHDLEKELAAAQANRASMAGAGNIGRSASITVAATEAGPATIELNYLVGNATWEPTYNVRTSLDGSSAQIEYDAMLTQRTGEDWDNVKLTLSTAQPNVAANPPSLQPWFVDIVRVKESLGYGRVMSSAPAAPARMETAGMDITDLMHVTDDAAVSGTGPSVSFELPRVVTVKTNSQKQQRTRIATINTNSQLVHVAMPLVTDAVYIRGDLINASAYQLLPGHASIFIGQDFVGPTTLPTVPPNGEFRLHFGIDNAVKATRQLVSKKTENTGLLGGGRRTSYEYRLLIDNGTGKPITLELWDRQPVSRAEEIQIDVIDLNQPLATDAKYIAEEKPQGLMKWLLSLPAGATGRNAFAVTYGLRVNRAKDVEMTPLPE